MKILKRILTTHKETLTIVNGLLLVAVFTLLSSCSTIDDAPSDCTQNQQEKITLSITPEQWGDSHANTRASYAAFSENSGNKTFSVTFQSGDAIGLFAVDKTGKVVVANQKYTYSGSAWTTDDPIEYVTGLGSYTFFAYYPWVSSLSGAPAVNDTPDITTASTFFADAITAWTPAADQSDNTKFTSQDLMIAKGVNTTPYFHEVQVSFTLAHQMGLLITKSSLSYYDVEDPSDTWEVEQTFSPNIPYAIGSNYYFFAKPGVATTLGTKTTSVQAGQVEQLFFTDGEPGKR